MASRDSLISELTTAVTDATAGIFHSATLTSAQEEVALQAIQEVITSHVQANNDIKTMPTIKIHT